MAVRIVRGSIVGGGGGAYLIAVDPVWARVYRFEGRELSRLVRIDTAFRMNPGTFYTPLDLLPEEADAILDAAHDPAVVEPEPWRAPDNPDERGPLPDVDLVERGSRPSR